jgi:hypothetical protein
MSYSRLIHDYLDGQLDAAEEDDLFSALARNSELRVEFNQQMRLGVAAQADMGSIAPPMASTNMIFSSLGFSIPSADYVDASAGTGAALAGFWLAARKYGAIIAAAVISAAITSMLFMFYNNSTEKSGNNNFASARNSHVPVVSSFQSDNSTGNIGQADSRSGNTQKAIVAAKNNTREDNYSGINNESASLAAQNDNNEAPAELTYNNTFKTGLANETSLFNLSGRNGFNSFAPAGAYVLLSPEMLNTNGANTNFMVQYRGFAGRSFPEPVIAGQGLGLTNNVAIALVYKFDKHHAAGLEFGKENLTQEYSKVVDNFTEIINKNPSLLWYGAFYRFSLPELGIGDIIVPYAQLMAGGTIIGPLGKLQAGFQIMPNSLVTMNIGYEGTGLVYPYPYRNQWLTSYKHGITAGVGINFNLFK